MRNSLENEHGLFGLARVEHAKRRLGLLDREGVRREPSEVDAPLLDHAGDLGIFGGAEIPRTHQRRLLADQLLARPDRGFARLADERRAAQRGQRVQQRVLPRRIAGAVDRRLQPDAPGELAQLVRRSRLCRVERHVRSKLLGEVAALGDRVQRHHAGAERLGRQHAGATHRAEAPDAERQRAGHAELAAGAVEGAERVGRDRGGHERHRVRDAQAVALRHHDVFGVAAVRGEADAPPRRAQVEQAATALRAGAAADRQMHRHAVADTERGDTSPNLLDHAGRLVAADAGPGGDAGQHGVAVVQAHVAAADAGGVDRDQDLAGSGPWDCHGAQLDPLVSGQKYGFHRRPPRRRCGRPLVTTGTTGVVARA